MNERHRITRDDVLSLLQKSSASGILSVYVGLETAGQHDPQKWLSVVRSGLRELGSARAPATLLELAQKEIGLFPREARHRSLIYFRSLDPDWSFWKSLQLDVPDLFAFDPSPQVHPLVRLLDRGPVLGIAVLSQEKSRVLSWNHGVIEEHEPLGAEPAEAAVAAAAVGKLGARSDAPARVADRTRRRLSHVAQELCRLGEERGWQRLLLIGTGSVAEAVHSSLADCWKRLLIHSLDRNLINAPAAEIGAVASHHYAQWKREEELREVTELVEETSAAGRARIGVEPCLESLNTKRVERLYLCADLSVGGFRDEEGKLHLRPPRIEPGRSFFPEPRLANRMVMAALDAGARVIPLEGQAATRLAAVGGCAARLRWKDGALQS